MTGENYDPLAPVTISDSNLSHAWGRALWYAIKNPGKEIKPLILSITGFDNGQPAEDANIRTALDAFLETDDKAYSVDIVGFTIFPQRYWQIAGGDRQQLYQIYMDAFPRLQAMNRQANGKGLYFQRLISYGSGPCEGNQLEFIITEYLERHGRRSKFQATTFDPKHDLNSQPYQSFPCLQQVSFVPTDEGLVVNAFYALQYLIGRGYGNILGLSHLGAFMAQEMGMDLAQVNMMAGVEQLDYTKTRLRVLIDLVGEKIPDLVPLA
jgi:hypothetical protein